MAARSRDPKASVRVGAPSDTCQILRGTPRPRGARRSPTCGSVSRRRRIAWQGRNFLARASPRTCGTSPARLPFPSSRDPAWWPVGCQGGKSGLTSARLRFCDPFTSRRDSQSAPPSEPPFLALPINRMRGSLQLTKRNEGIFLAEERIPRDGFFNPRWSQMCHLGNLSVIKKKSNEKYPARVNNAIELSDAKNTD